MKTLLAVLAALLLASPALAGTLAALRGDPALRFSTSDEVFSTAERSLARATAAGKGDIYSIPLLA